MSSQPITETIYTKYQFNDKELLDLSRKMAGAEAMISRKMEELKSVSTTIKADIASQEGVLHSCAEKMRSGYEMRPCEVTLDYGTKGTVKYISNQTGEVVQERPITEEEQLHLAEGWVDAEKVIRDANEEEE